MRKLILILCFAVFLIGIVSAEQITVKGRAISLINNQPLANLDISKWDGDSMHFNIGKTDADGRFNVVFDLDEAQKVDRGDSQSNYYFRVGGDCLVGADILLYRLDNQWKILIPMQNDNIAGAILIVNNMDVGDIPLNSMADFSLESDLSVKMSYTWKYLSKNWIEKYGEKWKAGSYDIQYQYDKQYSQYISQNSYVRFRLINEDGDLFISPVYWVGEDICTKIELNFKKKEFSSNLHIAEVQEGPFDDNAVTVQINKGWNLLSLSSVTRLSSRSYLQAENFKAVYFYIPQISKYIGIDAKNPNSDTVMRQLQENGKSEGWFRENMYYFLNQGAWIYSNKNGEATFILGDDVLDLNYSKLASGWNFKVIIGTGTFDSKKGNCNIEKIASWNSETQSWNMVDSNADIKNYFNKVVVIKVTNDCQLGENNINPPSIPS